MKKCNKCKGNGYTLIHAGERLGNRKLQVIGGSINSYYGGKIKIVCPKCYGKGMR